VARVEEEKNTDRPVMDKGSLKTSISKIKKKTNNVREVILKNRRGG